MSSVCRDNWERLMAVVLKRQQYLDLCNKPHSRSPSTSTISSDFSEESQRFLPWDLLQTVSRSVSPMVYANKKDLYSDPILINAGKLSFCVEKESGKKCYMVGARELGIIWGRDTRYWKFVSHPDSRFSEVAVLKSVCWLEIRGTIHTWMLSSNTIYGAYLVFKLDDRNAYGLESAKAVVRFTNDKVDDDERRANLNHLEREKAVHLQWAKGSEQQRGIGWMEVELGSFFNDQGDDGAVETRLLGKEGLRWKSGLIVQGIEFRPKPSFLSGFSTLDY